LCTASRRAQQGLRAVHQQVRIADRHERVVRNTQLAPQPGQLGLGRGKVAGVGEDRLELHKVPELLDFVEMDPHALPQEQPPSLGHDDDRAERRVECLDEDPWVRDWRQHVRALARLGVIGSAVGDELRRGGLVSSELEAAAPGGEVDVALVQRAGGGGAEA
jgi:hypothetical protein